MTVYTTRPDTLFGATFMVVAADAEAGRASWSPTTSGRRTRSTWRRSARPPRSSGCRPSARRPACSWAATPSTRSTGSGSRSGRPTTCWPTTAPARSWPCPARTSATGTSPSAFDLPIIRTVRPARRLRAARRTSARATAINSANDEISLNGMGDRRGQVGDHRVAGAEGRRQGRGQLPAARLAAVAAALLGRADPDRPLPRRAARCRCPTTSCPSCCRSCAAPT